MKKGELVRAIDLLGPNSNNALGVASFWLGEAYRRIGKLEKAQKWYHSWWTNPIVHERLGLLYEQMNKPYKAAAAYRRFIEAWKNADPELQDRVEQARERLQSLTISEGEATKEVL